MGKNLIAAIPFECPVLNGVGRGRKCAGKAGEKKEKWREEEGERRSRREGE